MKKIALLPLALLLACGEKETKLNPPGTDTSAVPQDSLSANKQPEEGEMKTFYMVFLNKGSKRDQDSATAEQIQKMHLAHMDSLAAQKKLVVAGPFLDEGNTRGICIYSVATLEEAKMLAEGDPAVKAGRLAVEVRPWMTQKGVKIE